MSCVWGRDVVSDLHFPSNPSKVQETSMCLSPWGVERPKTFICIICLDEFLTQEEAEACRRAGGGDTVWNATG